MISNTEIVKLLKAILLGQSLQYDVTGYSFLIRLFSEGLNDSQYHFGALLPPIVQILHFSYNSNLRLVFVLKPNLVRK